MLASRAAPPPLLLFDGSEGIVATTCREREREQRKEKEKAPDDEGK